MPAGNLNCLLSAPAIHPFTEGAQAYVQSSSPSGRGVRGASKGDLSGAAGVAGLLKLASPSHIFLKVSKFIIDSIQGHIWARSIPDFFCKYGKVIPPHIKRYAPAAIIFILGMCWARAPRPHVLPDVIERIGRPPLGHAVLGMNLNHQFLLQAPAAFALTGAESVIPDNSLRTAGAPTVPEGSSFGFCVAKGYDAPSIKCASRQVHIGFHGISLIRNSQLSSWRGK